ncbi:hypothetical protein [Oceanibaculum indicum]|uniref:Uncharacterized protein n=1 Tax=Oceanibaculum indicum TaxID=526216 RepID=A0A420WGW2_9PROT|nr:hypothetical protein [Oceanibaculum indicum]RKQ70175.1 hypothetical protein BCL74_2116 [Oceanibaculum indicum]
MSSVPESIARFFDLRKAGELQDFIAGLDPADPLQAALRRYALTWPASSSTDGDAAFDPARHLSTDLSAALLGDCPCIFLGSNDWAIRAMAPIEALDDNVRLFARHVRYVRRQYRDREVLAVVVPEKDFLMDALFTRTGDYAGMTEAMKRLGAKLKENGINLLFNQFIDGLEKYQPREELLYFDTHLPTRNYVQILANVLQTLDLDWRNVQPSLHVIEGEQSDNLLEKLTTRPEERQPVYVPDFPGASVTLSAGDEGYRTPLGETWQRYANKNPIIAKKVLLLGDSHSSIYANRKLTYLFSSVFAETEFHWNPCGMRGVLPETDADIVILEISQRFMFGEKLERKIQRPERKISRTDRKILLHVGYPKCGSTSLQEALTQAEGIIFPASGRHGGEHLALPLHVKGLDSWTAQWFSQEWVDTQHAALLAEIEAASGTVVLSSERLASCSPEQVEKLDEMLDGWQVEVVIVTRQIDKFFDSLWRHAVFRHDYADNKQHMIENMPKFSFEHARKVFSPHFPVHMLDMDSPDYEDRLSALFGAPIKVGHANVGVPAALAELLQTNHRLMGSARFKAAFPYAVKEAMRAAMAGEVTPETDPFDVPIF